MHALPLPVAAPLLLLLACTPTGEPDAARDVPAATDRGSTDLEAPTLRPRPPRPPIVGAIVASTSPAADAPRCADRPASTEVVPIDPRADPTPGRMAVKQGDAWLGLPLRETRYDTLVVGNMAETSLIQVFYNPRPEPLTALYSFPLPPDAAVDDVSIRLAGREIRGVMQAHADAPSPDRAASEPRWPNQFTQSVDLPPGATVEVELRLVQPLRRQGGRYGLVLPIASGPRAIPDDPAAIAGVPCSPVDLQVTLAAGVPVTALSSTSHALTVETVGDRVRLELRRGAPRPDRDFELSWQLAGPEPRAQLIAQETADGGYFTLTIEPPQTHAQARPRELIFALDASDGAGMATAVDAIRRALVTMGPDDTFQILRFANHPGQLAPAPLRNTLANVARAVDFLTPTPADDHRESLAGITAALARSPDPGRLRMVLFVTDGLIADPAGLLAALTQHRGDARLFGVGVAAPSHHPLLDAISRIGRGATLYIDPNEQPGAFIERFHEHIAAPVLTDIEIDWGDLPVVDVVPAALPDLFAGQPVVVYGRFTRAPTGEARLKARLGAAAIELPLRLDRRGPAAHAGLRAMWSRRQVDALLGYPNSKSVAPDAMTLAAVTELALAHRVTTPFTRFGAVETRVEQQPDGTLRTVQVPVAAPDIVTLAEPGDLATLAGGGGGSGFGRGGSGLGGRSVRVPTVRQARAEVLGGLDPDLVRRVVRAHIHEVRHCYNNGLARDRNIQGRVSVEFAIDTHGKVSASSVKEDTVPDKTVAPCIAAAARRWRFPKPQSCGPVIVVYPFVLEPG